MLSDAAFCDPTAYVEVDDLLNEDPRIMPCGPFAWELLQEVWAKAALRADGEAA